MPTFETPPDFPGTDEISKGDSKKFLFEAKCTGKEDDGSMEWETQTIDGVKIPKEDKEEEAEGDNSDDGMDEYDTSSDESSGPTDSKGVASLIMGGKQE